MADNPSPPRHTGIPARIEAGIDIGVRLLRQLTLPQKVTGLALVMLLPCVGLLSMTATDVLSHLRDIDADRRAMSLVATSIELAAFQSLSRTEPGGNAQARTAALEARLAHSLEAAPRTVRLATAQHSDIAALTTLARAAAEDTGAETVPDKAAQLILHTAAHALAPWLAAIHQADAAEPKAPAAAFSQLDQHMELLGRELGSAPTTWIGMRSSGERLLAVLRRDGPAPDEDALRLAKRDALHTSLHLLNSLQQQFDRHMAARAAALRKPLLLGCGIGALSLLVVGYLGMALHRGIAQSLHSMLQGVRAVTEGDLSRRFSIPGRDEVAAIGAELDKMTRQLSRMTGDVRGAALRVGQASQAVADDGHQLATHSQWLAARLREATGGLNELDKAITHSADSASRLCTQLRQLGERVSTGNASMAESLTAIEALEASAKRVAEINGVIDDIAHQTNLLALNASVEAARAGGAGRGFAVVAGEIRQLAQRCSASAAETRELIDETSLQVARCSASVREADATLSSLAHDMEDVTGQLDALARDSTEHHQRVLSTADGVRELSDGTQQNMQGVRRCGDNARLLVAQSQGLQQSVGSIKLRYGSTDEARAMVERGLHRIAEVGLTQALAEFNQPHGPYRERDLYIFCLDSEGCYLALSLKPSLVGHRFQDTPGLPISATERFLAQARAVLANGPGWVEFDGGEGTVQRYTQRTVWVAPLEHGGLIGCAAMRPEHARMPSPTPTPPTEATLAV